MGALARCRMFSGTSGILPAVVGASRKIQRPACASARETRHIKMVLPENRPPPSAATYAIASGIVAGIFGYFLGQFSTLGKVTNTNNAFSDSSTDADDTDLTDKNSEQCSGSLEECKLVLVVRTDLGMTKGVSPLAEIRSAKANLVGRQNCSSVLARDPRLLQAFGPARSKVGTSATLGNAWTSKSRSAGEERGGSRDAPGPSNKLRALRTSRT